MGKIEGMVWLLTVKQRTPIYPWVQGTLEEALPDRTFVANSYSFIAKVSDEESEFGINNGRISKLTVWRNELGCDCVDCNRHTFAHYDRGWNIQPTSAIGKETLQRILSGLEESPRQQHKRC